MKRANGIRSVVRVLGVVLIIVDIAVFVVEHFALVPLVGGQVSTKGHIGLLIVGYLMADHERALLVYAVVKDKLPTIGGKKE